MHVVHDKKGFSSISRVFQALGMCFESFLGVFEALSMLGRAPRKRKLNAELANGRLAMFPGLIMASCRANDDGLIGFHDLKLLLQSHRFWASPSDVQIACE